jgi:hypothetical protein
MQANILSQEVRGGPGIIITARGGRRCVRDHLALQLRSENEVHALRRYWPGE